MFLLSSCTTVDSSSQQQSKPSKMVHPNALFSDIDNLLESYLKLKKEYNKEWIITQRPSFDNIPQNIQKHIQKMQIIENNMNKWLKKLQKLLLNKKKFKINNNYKATPTKYVVPFALIKSPSSNASPPLISQSNTQSIMSVYAVDDNKDDILSFYHDNYYGQNCLFSGVFGVVPIIYCDWTASGKSLRCIESYISSSIYPLYANTHTQTSITGNQTSRYRSESRNIILKSIGGNINKDSLIFCGSGVTGAIYKLSNILMKSTNFNPSKTIVFVSIYEHNSNIYIWKELGIKVIIIPGNNDGINKQILEKYLKLYTSLHLKKKYNLIIGSFTAASNVTGIISDIDNITKLLHKYNALSFWDYATAGPYLDINMTNDLDESLSKDAVFISTHKFLGGPGSPGILCAKRKLFNNAIPVVPGGGTVYVAYGIKDNEYEYLDNISEREEGGTPDIIGSIRASLTFMIKDIISTKLIKTIEKKYIKYLFDQTSNIQNLHILGPKQCDRLPIISFLISYTNNNNIRKYLHHNFIAALFNDLFGIQGRGGCSCAGMYGLKLLNLNDNQIDDTMNQIRNTKNELIRPGYFRINLHYTLNKKELNYVINAIKFVSKNGWLFLPIYDVDWKTGIYYARYKKIQLKSLMNVSFNEINSNKKEIINNSNNNNNDFNKYFSISSEILSNLKNNNYNLPKNKKEEKNYFKNENKINNFESIYWFPSELYKEIKNELNLK